MEGAFTDPGLSAVIRACIMDDERFLEEMRSDPQRLRRLVFPHLHEGIVTVPADATRKSLLAGVRGTDKSPGVLDFTAGAPFPPRFDERLMDWDFPVVPGRYRFRGCAPLKTGKTLRQLRAEEHDGFVGRVAPFLALLIALKPKPGASRVAEFTTVPAYRELWRDGLRGESHTVRFCQTWSESSFGLRSVRTPWYLGHTILTFSEPLPLT